MSHMLLFTEYMQAYRVETSEGTEIVPYNAKPGATFLYQLDPYCNGRPRTFAIVEGWFARYSAPGFLDCTDWCGPCGTRAEAQRECVETYGEVEA